MEEALQAAVSPRIQSCISFSALLIVLTALFSVTAVCTRSFMVGDYPVSGWMFILSL
jgi:hypothetical protein